MAQGEYRYKNKLFSHSGLLFAWFLYERWSAFTARYEPSAKTRFSLVSFYWPQLGSSFQYPACHRRGTWSDAGAIRRKTL